MTVIRLAGDIIVVRAAPQATGMAREVLAEAGEWLLQRGIRQWLGPPPLDTLRAAAERGELYLAVRGRTAIGTFRLGTADHSRQWGADFDDAAYLSSIARRPSSSEMGLGAALLEVAASIGVSLGKSRLRLDCWAGNERLRRFYREIGFTEVKTAPENDYLICLLERPLMRHPRKTPSPEALHDPRT